MPGLGNPKPRYRREPRNCGPLVRRARKLRRRARLAAGHARRPRPAGHAKSLRQRAGRLRSQARGAVRIAGRCRRVSHDLGHSSGARASVATRGGAGPQGGGASSAAAATTGRPGSSPGPAGAAAQGLLPGAAGFEAAAYADGGTAATEAGSHPYSLELGVGLDQGGREADLRSLLIDLPPGLLANPATTSTLCSDAAFATPRSSPYESSQSGESCPDRSQVGTVEVSTGGGQAARFGLFELNPPGGAAMRLGASPFGTAAAASTARSARTQRAPTSASRPARFPSPCGRPR